MVPEVGIRTVVSFMTCEQNLRSFGIGFIGLGISFRSWKFISSLGLNWGKIRDFDIV